VVADLVKHHVVTLKAVVDAQAAKDPARAFTAVRTAAAHIAMIADPLAEAIAKQFPDRFMAGAKSRRTPTTRGRPGRAGAPFVSVR
jgi:hypothetical protein